MSRIINSLAAVAPPTAAMAASSAAAALTTPGLPWHDAAGLTCVGLMTFLTVDRFTGALGDASDSDTTEEA